MIFYLPWDEETLSPLQNAESVDDSIACCSNNLWVGILEDGEWLSQTTEESHPHNFRSLVCVRNMQGKVFTTAVLTSFLPSDYVFMGVVVLLKFI